jgi:hypothetical protein
MKKILLSVEGQTEESFVKQLLQPLFRQWVETLQQRCQSDD